MIFDRRCPLSLRADSFVFLLIVLILSLCETLIFPRLTTRFCYNSPEPNLVTSQCVLCNYFQFDGTVLGCTGSTALSMNITAQQAFCVISQCIGQVRQAPMFLGMGRKKRATESGISGDDKSEYDDKKLAPNDDSDAVESIEYEMNGIKDQVIVKNEYHTYIVDFSDLAGEDDENVG